MNHLKMYENFSPWKKGDIIVCVETFCSINNCVYKNGKYKINNISPKGKVEVRSIEKNIIIPQFFSKNLFITEEDWKMREDAKIYNL